MERNVKCQKITSYSEQLFIESQTRCYLFPKQTCCVADERQLNGSDELVNADLFRPEVQTAQKELQGKTRQIYIKILSPYEIQYGNVLDWGNHNVSMWC